MRGLVEFWQWIISGAIDIVIEYWYIPAGYAVLYAVGATIFLLTLRMRKNSNGILVLERDSLAYRVAHPIEGSRHAERSRLIASGTHWITEEDQPLPVTGNICAIFFRLFNMLLFVWPFLLIWLAAVFVFGNLGGLLCAGKAVTPTLAHLNDRAGDTHDVFIGTRRMPPLLAVIAPVVLFVSLIFARAGLGRFLLRAATVLMYAAPLLIAIAFIWWLSHRLRGAESVGVVREVFSSVKTRACKLVEIR